MDIPPRRGVDPTHPPLRKRERLAGRKCAIAEDSPGAEIVCNALVDGVSVSMATLLVNEWLASRP